MTILRSNNQLHQIPNEENLHRQYFQWKVNCEELRKKNAEILSTKSVLLRELMSNKDKEEKIIRESLKRRYSPSGGPKNFVIQVGNGDGAAVGVSKKKSSLSHKKI